MKRCGYCGRENEGAADVCEDCGQQLKEIAETIPAPSPAQQSRPFFRWKRASAVLVCLSLLFFACMLLSVRSAKLYEQIGNHGMARFCYFGVLWNGLISFLCFFARDVMTRRTPAALACGGLMVMIAFFVAERHWVFGWRASAPRIELLLIPAFFYPIVYSFREVTNATRTQSDAAEIDAAK